MGNVVQLKPEIISEMAVVGFRNKGIIDKRAITTLGVCSKDTDSPIGYFGTGLKYAIACLLRAGHTITIYAGGEELEFTCRKEAIRNGEFEIVYMNDERLGFTTELGKNWEMWQVLRELYSNCLDENGSMFFKHGGMVEYTALADETTIIVDGEEFYQVAQNAKDVFIDTEPDLTLPTLEIHPGGSCEYIYYRGIRVGKYDKPYANKYNILEEIWLTEDRTVKYQWQVDNIIRDAIASSNDADHVYLALVANEKYQESRINFAEVPSYIKPSEVFMETVARLRFEKIDYNKSATTLYEKNLSTGELVIPFEPDDREALDFKHTIDYLGKLGITFSQEFVFVQYLPGSVVCMCEGDKIYLSKLYFSKAGDDQKKILLDYYFEEHYDLPKDAMMAKILDLGDELLRLKWDESRGAAQVPRQWIIEGEWSGYTSKQTKISHRALMTEETYEKAKFLETIVFMDGTRLSISFREYNANYPFEPLNGYGSLIDKAIRYGKPEVNVKELS